VPGEEVEMDVYLQTITQTSDARITPEVNNAVSAIERRFAEYIDRPAQTDSSLEQRQRELRDIIRAKDSARLEDFLKKNEHLGTSVRNDVETLQNNGMNFVDYFRILYEPSKSFKGEDVELGLISGRQ
jgi:hypothetical protein